MKQDKHALVAGKYLLPFILVTSLFFLWGFARSILDVLNKHFQDDLDITKTHSAMIQVMFYLGYFIMAIPAGLFITKYGYRRGVVVGLLLFSLGSFFFIPGEMLMSFNFFLFSLFVIACGLVFLEIAANPYMTKLGNSSTAASRLNLAQSFNGLGCICGPLIGVAILFSDDNSTSLSIPYSVMGLLVLLFAFIFSRVNLPEIVSEESEEVVEVKNVWRDRMFVLGIITLFAYEIAEISINSFFINYAVDDNFMSAKDAALFLSFGGLGLFMLGRFAGSWIMSRIDAQKVLLVCGIMTVISTFIIVIDLGIISKIGLLGIYVFESIMFPTIFALSLKNLGTLTKKASSYLMMTPIGGAVGPLLMGYVADNTSMSLSFIVPLFGFIVVMLYAFIINKKQL